MVDEGEAEEDMGSIARVGDVSIIRDRNSVGETFQFRWARQVQTSDTDQTSLQSAASSQAAFDAVWAGFGSPRSAFYAALSNALKAEWRAQAGRMTSSTRCVYTYQTAEHWTVGAGPYATLRAAMGSQSAFDAVFTGLTPAGWYASLAAGVQASFRALCTSVAL